MERVKQLTVKEIKVLVEELTEHLVSVKYLENFKGGVI